MARQSDAQPRRGYDTGGSWPSRGWVTGGHRQERLKFADEGCTNHALSIAIQKLLVDSKKVVSSHLLTSVGAGR
jgi:hypothetical protein